MRLVEGSGFILPDFVFCLLLGVVIRNATNFIPASLKLSERTVELVGDVALSLFLVMALMTMKLLDLANLAGPAAHHPGAAGRGDDRLHRLHHLSASWAATTTRR